MTEAAERALVGLRDFTTLQWYVVPLLALLFYIYVTEAREARRTGNWDAVIAGVTLFSADFVNESNLVHNMSQGRGYIPRTQRRA